MGKIICPDSGFDTLTLFPRDIGYDVRTDFSVYPISYSANWARRPAVAGFYDRTVIYEFDSKRVRDRCPDRSLTVVGYPNGKVIIHYTPGLVNRVSIFTETNTGGLRKVRKGQFLYFPYRAILVQTEPFSGLGDCVGPGDGITSFNHFAYFCRAYGVGPQRVFHVSSQISATWDMTNKLTSVNRVPRQPKYTVLGDDPNIYQIYKDRGFPVLSSVYEEDKNEFLLNLISSLDELSFTAYIGLYVILAIGSILEGTIPEKVFIPSGCDWLEYNLDIDLESISSATLWVKWEDCNGVRFIPYPDYTSEIPFGVEWPEEVSVPEDPPEDTPPEASINYSSSKELLERMVDNMGCSTEVLYLTNVRGAPDYMDFDPTDSEFVTLENPTYGPNSVYDGCMIGFAEEDDTSFNGYNQHLYIFNSNPPEWWREARDLDTNNPPPEGTDDCEINWNVELFKDDEVVARFGVTIPNLLCSMVVQFGVRMRVGTTVSLGGITWKTEVSNSF
jgi:hypothetical protein